jgi:hypothetical protein
MKILVTISRDWDDKDAVCAALHRACEGVPARKVTVVHGGSQMDWFIAGVACAWGMTTVAVRANWRRDKLAAGPLRNTAMVAGGADLCLAFIKGHSAGATDCADKAERAGIPVKRIRR